MDMMMLDLLNLPVRELATRIAEGSLRAETVTQGFLARCVAREDIEAFVHLDPEQSLAEARARDAAPAPAMLQGIPIAVKDVIDTADMPTAYGCAGYVGVRPKADAGCVALAREAGAVVLGKTVTTEFAGPAPRQTRNPWDNARTPGGSSSGSAAAVGAGLAPLGFGTQTAGSVIRPGSYCGAVAYKPSYGLITRSGVSPLSDSLDTIGLYARQVEDVAWFAAALTGRMALTAPLSAGLPHIGLYDEAGWAELSPENQIALRQAASALADAGAKLSALPRFAHHDRALDAQQALMDWEVPRALAYERTRLFDRLSPITQAFITRKQPSPAEYDAALADAAAARAALRQQTAGLDGWIAPAAPGVAPIGLGNTGDPIFNRLWTVLHVPCLSVPCIRHDGMPVGVQIIARDDATALGLAQFLETALQGAK